MSDNWSMLVRARDGAYRVIVDDNAFERFAHTRSPKQHVIVDEHVAHLYGGELRLDLSTALLVEADEEAKSIGRIGWYAKLLLDAGIRRDHEIVAIGGGVTQDIACFLAGTLLRGVPWTFYPTTLLAQCDSCIGGKSSINVGSYKNAMGTFTPPRAVWIVPHVLKSLPDTHMHSGAGEMLKIHAIEGPSYFDYIAAYYPRLGESAILQRFVRQSLIFKKFFVEADEFDVGVRRLLNYGHTFGHAIESVTDYAVPHGIAVSIGMDIANHCARWSGKDALGSSYVRMHPTLAANYAGFDSHVSKITVDTMLCALSSDKKNTGDDVLTLILPDSGGRVHECKWSTSAVAEALRAYGFAEKGAHVCV